MEEELKHCVEFKVFREIAKRSTGPNNPRVWLKAFDSSLDHLIMSSLY